MPPSSDSKYPDLAPQALALKEQGIEDSFIEKLQSLKYTYRPDIRDRASLEKNFREKFEALNRVRLTDGEFQRLLDELITPDVFIAARVIREKNDFTRDDGTPLTYTLVNIKDWCKNDFEVIHQLRINTDYSHHRYDVILLINGVPVAQVELKTLGVNTIKHILASELKTLTVFVPDLDEQQRIADCLSALDELIAAQSAQLAAHQTHKQGLMQNLFPSAVETTS